MTFWILKGNIKRWKITKANGEMNKSCKPQYMAQSKSQNMTMFKFLGKYTSTPSTEPRPTVKNGYELLI